MIPTWNRVGSVVAAVDSIVNRLAERAPEMYDWDVRVIDADMINAFATPGGFIVIHSGLLERTERPEELAGVLAHEMQHVLNHHGIKALVRQLPFRLLLGAVMGDASVFTGAVEAIGVVGLLRYQRRDEEEADRKGLAILQAASVDPEGMPDFFEILQREALDVSGVLTYLSTHPNTGWRIAVLDSLIAAGPATPIEPLLPGIEWETTRAACFASSAGG